MISNCLYDFDFLKKDTNLKLEICFLRMKTKRIVLEFAKTPLAASVRRVFIAIFKIKVKATVRYWHVLFTRIRDHFEKFSSVHVTKWKEMKTKMTEATVDEVKKFLQENPTCSLRKAVQTILPTKTTMWRVVSYHLKLRFYHCTSVQLLTDAHKAQRRKFCQWVREQPSEFVEKVVGTDEKFFCLHQKPHR